VAVVTTHGRRGGGGGGWFWRLYRGPLRRPDWGPSDGRFHAGPPLSGV